MPPVRCVWLSRLLPQRALYMACAKASTRLCCGSTAAQHAERCETPHHTLACLMQPAQPSLCRACCSPRYKALKLNVGAVQQACLEALDIIAKATLQDEVALSLAGELPPECLESEGLYLLVSMMSQTSSIPHLRKPYAA